MFDGVLMYWMSDWLIFCLLFVVCVYGVCFYDVDGYVYVDFCLGDIGSMFGYFLVLIVWVFVE